MRLAVMAAAAVAACLATVTLSLKFCALTPYADHWTLVAQPYLSILDGRPLGSVIWEQDNDSRMPVPRLIYLALAWATHWDLRAENLATLFLAACIAGGFVWLMQRNAPVETKSWWLIALLGLDLIFTPHQWMNWLFGVILAYFLVIAAAIGIAVVGSTGWRFRWQFAAACALSLIGTFSFLNGWLLWGMVGLLVIREGWTSGWRHRHFIGGSLALMAIMGVTLALYFSGYVMRIDHGTGPGLGERLLTQPLEFVKFFLQCLGAPFAEGWPTPDRELRGRFQLALAPWTSGLALALFIAVLFCAWRSGWRVESKTVWPWLALSLWTLAVLAVVTIGRVGAPLSGPYQSRYIGFSIWFYLPLLVMCGLSGVRVLRCLGGILAVWMVWGYGVGNVVGYREMEKSYYQNAMQSAAVMFRKVAPEPELFRAIKPDHDDWLQMALDRFTGMGMMRPLPVKSALVSETASAMGERKVKGEIDHAGIDATGALVIEGWAVWDDSRRPVEAIAISYQAPGQPEQWLGIAQRRALKRKGSERLGVSALGGRIGWVYTRPAEVSPAGVTGDPAVIAASRLPSGPLTIRAYAVEPASSLFVALPGQTNLNIP